MSWMIWLTQLTLLLGAPGPSASKTTATAKQSTQQKSTKGKPSLKKNWWKDFHLAIRGRMFAGFRATFLEQDSFNEFDLHEVQLRTRMHWKNMLGFALRLEVLRSAQPQSLFGIDGDAYIIRLQQAWGFGRVAFWHDRIEFEARFGLIFEPWVELLEQGYLLRDVSVSLSQGGDFFFPSDIGVSFAVRFWHGLVEARYAITNGEGPTRTEQNAGKNSTITATVRPLAWMKKKWFGYRPKLSLHFVYRDGSLGTGLAANHRLGGALTFVWGPYNLGLEYINANGWRGDGSLHSDGLGVWLNAAFYRHYAGISARYDRLNTNLAVEDAIRQRLSVGLYTDAFLGLLWRGFRRFRFYALYQYETQGQNSGPLPGFPAAGTAHRLLFILSIYAGVNI